MNFLSDHSNAFHTLYGAIDNSSISFLPPFIFFGILIISFWIGFWNGRRVSLYFLIGSIVSFFLGVLILVLVEGALQDEVARWKFKIGDLKAEDLVERGSFYIRSIFGGIIILSTMLFTYLVQFVVYLFIRKKLKNEIWLLKKENKKATGRRVWGGTIALISGLPFSTVLATYTGVFTTETAFVSFLEHMLEFMTIGQIKEPCHNSQQLIKTLYYSDTIYEKGSDIAAVFGSKDITDKDVLNKLLQDGTDTKKALENLLVDSFLTENMDLVVKTLPHDSIQGIQLEDHTTVSWVNPVNDSLRLSITDDNFASLVKSLTKGIKERGGKATIDGVKFFFEQINIFKIIK